MMMLRVALKDLRLRFRDPLALLLWLGIPIMIGGLITTAFGAGGGPPKAQIWIVDQDNSFLSQMLAGVLSGQNQDAPFSGEQVSLEEGRARIDDGKGTALLIVPKGFQDAVLDETPTKLQLITNPAQRILPQIVEEVLGLLTEIVFYLQRLFGDQLREFSTEDVNNPLALLSKLAGDEALVARLKRLGELLFPPVLTAEVVVEKKEQAVQKGIGELFLPSMLFMALFFMAQGVSGDIWEEKNQGTLRRFLSTPNRVFQLMAGKILAAVLLTALISSVGLGLARYAFGMQMANLAGAIAWASISGAMLTLLMMLLQMLASSQRAAGMLTSVVLIPLLMLGGSFFPFDSMPAGMAALGRYTPNGWSLTHLVALMDGETQLSDMAQPAAIGIGICLVLFIICTQRAGGAFARS
ncbi:MAG: ABC transporter permease [Acidobacteriota bacterium]|nr:ABC transporter permease [Acidobacteriota bacterium]